MTGRGLKNASPSKRNPRRITQAQLHTLRRSLSEFGDLSGIVINKSNGHEIISGHQRREAFLRLPDAEIHIVRTFEKPTRTGTIAEGYICLEGENYSYREVIWPDPHRAQLAMLAANKMGGDWDIPLLADNLKDLHFAGADLDLSGFDAAERAALFNEVPEWKSDDLGDKDEATASATVCPSCGHEW